jgi:RimJ/RimL family protein N-acetyltransferase
LIDGEIGLCADDSESVLAASKSLDYQEEIERWARLAELREDILYFGISYRGVVVGQMFLHDRAVDSRESLVGYHIYMQEMRGRGIGSRALLLLLRFVAERTDIASLIAITTDDNLASLGIARRAGFELLGPSREDPEHGVVMRWQVRRGQSQTERQEKGTRRR